MTVLFDRTFKSYILELESYKEKKKKKRNSDKLISISHSGWTGAHMSHVK